MVNHPNRKKAAIGLSASRTHGVPVRPRARAGHDADWAAFIHGVATTFIRRASARPLFCTNVESLNDIYLKHLGTERGIHDCSACRHFLQRYGGLVVISEAGVTAPALWDPDMVPMFYRKAVALMAARVLGGTVTGPFLSSDSEWGIAKTGEWTHMSVRNPSVFRHPLLSAGQAMAAKREDFKNVAAGLADFKPEVIAEALRLLEAGHLSSPEKFTAPLSWLANLHAQRKGVSKPARDNILWRAVATAPDGFCHPRSAVTGTLLEDLAAGISFAEVKRRFDAKLGPLQYQRPQASPKAGNVARAEEIFAKLGLERALHRRFARLDEVQTAWAPFVSKRKAPARGGIFSHLASRGAGGGVRAAGTPAATMTWEKFARTVLPGAEAIEAHISDSTRNFIAMTTAVHDDAPPILKWDSVEESNPVAWYVYPGGSMPGNWSMRTGWQKVTAIVPLPPMWGDNPKPNLGEGFVLALDGCEDQRLPGLALFPECLRAELHEVRSTIEAHSRSGQMRRTTGPLASGLDVRKDMKGMNYLLRVTAGGLQTDYRIDRWD